MANHKHITGMNNARPHLKNKNGEKLPQKRCYEMSPEFLASLKAEASGADGVSSVPAVPPVPA
jgi:hypothetical protein